MDSVVLVVDFDPILGFSFLKANLALWREIVATFRMERLHGLLVVRWLVKWLVFEWLLVECLVVEWLIVRWLAVEWLIVKWLAVECLVIRELVMLDCLIGCLVLKGLSGW